MARRPASRSRSSSFSVGRSPAPVRSCSPDLRGARASAPTDLPFAVASPAGACTQQRLLQPDPTLTPGQAAVLFSSASYSTLALVGLDGLRWDVLLDVTLPLPPQTKERHRSAIVKTGQGRGRGAGLDQLLGLDGRHGRGSARRSPSADLYEVSGRQPSPEIRTYTPAATRAWTRQAAMVLGAHFRAAGQTAPGRHEPVRVDVVFSFARPAKPAHPVFHVVRPDRDNLDKIVLDALVKAGVLLDDAQVCAGGPLKVYAPVGERPSVRVLVAVLGASAELVEPACRS